MTTCTTREEVFEHLKLCVLALQYQIEEIGNNPAVMQRWKEKTDQVKKGLEGLSEDDAVWFKEEWLKWINEHVGAKMSEIILTFG